MLDGDHAVEEVADEPRLYAERRQQQRRDAPAPKATPPTTNAPHPSIAQTTEPADTALGLTPHRARLAAAARANPVSRDRMGRRLSGEALTMSLNAPRDGQGGTALQSETGT